MSICDSVTKEVNIINTEISVVIPVYGCRECLPELIHRISTTLEKVANEYEIVLVNDASPDGAWETIVELATEDRRIVGINLSRNFGQHYAITAGIDACRGDYCVVMDCDLQDRPDEIPRLLEKAKEGYEVVLARRALRKDSFIKRFGSRFFYKIFGLLSGFRMDETVGTFRILKRPAVDAFCRMRETYRLFGGMIEWAGFRTAYVDVEHARRMEGKSSYSLRRLLKLAMDGILSFSNRPLYISVACGAFMALFSSGYGVFQLIRYLIIGSFGVPGWLSIVALQAFVGGIILLNLGIVGLYIGRIYDQTKNRPLYVVSDVIGHSLPKSDFSSL